MCNFFRISNKQSLKTCSRKAYSLIELSIVILIISILITGALSISVSNVNNAKVKVTNDRIREIYKAIGNFLLSNRRLPCPASLKKVKTVDSDYGSEVGGGSGCVGSGVYVSSANGATSLVYGMVPVRALGLTDDMAEDAFESKIAYVVDKDFTNFLQTVPDFSGSHPTFATAPYTSTITINEEPAGVVQAATNDAVMVLISYGANKLGAFNANSSAQNQTSSDAAEQYNYPSSFDDSGNTAVFNKVFFSSSGNSDSFDDIVFFKRRNDIVGDFNGMFLIPCQGTTSDNFGGANAYYGQIVYATSSCSSPDLDKRLTKKCEAYGNWVNIVSACPSS